MAGKRQKNKISLCKKIILIIVVVLILCTSMWTAIMFFNMSKNAKSVALANEKTNMLNVAGQYKDVEEACYLMQQIILQKKSIKDYIQDVQKGIDFNTVEKIDFYDTEIGSIEYMININPYMVSGFMRILKSRKNILLFIKLTA